MYEAIRSKSVHSTAAGTTSDFPTGPGRKSWTSSSPAISRPCSPSRTSCARWPPTPTWTPRPSGSPGRWPGCAEAGRRSACR